MTLEAIGWPLLPLRVFMPTSLNIPTIFVAQFSNASVIIRLLDRCKNIIAKNPLTIPQHFQDDRLGFAIFIFR